MSDIVPLSPGQRRLATFALGLANFMVVLDTTIANVSVPTIAGGLAVSPAQGTWVITSYAVAEAVMVPLSGWLTARFGTVRLFVAAVLAFGFFSLLCGFATSIEMLVLFRVLQGLAGGPLMPLSQTMLMASYPREKMGAAIGIWSMTTLLAPIAGPVLGGWISENISWPWIFYINVPVALVCGFFVYRIYADHETTRRRTPIDYVGLGLLLTWVGALQLMLDKGRELDWFGSPFIVALAVVSGVAFLFFIIWELDEEHPIVDLHLFGDRNFLVGVVSSSLIFGLFFGSVVLIPLWLQTQMGYTSTWAGLAMSPIGVLAIVVAPLVGKNLHRVDARLFLTASLTILALTFFMRSHFNMEADYWVIVLPQIIQGIGMPMFFLPLTALSFATLPRSMTASASGLQNFLRTSGGAFAAALVTTYWDERTVEHRAALSDHLSRFDPETNAYLHTLQGVTHNPEQALANLDRVLQSQAAMSAMVDFFQWGSLLFVVLILVVWFGRPPARVGAAAGGPRGH